MYLLCMFEHLNSVKIYINLHTLKSPMQLLVEIELMHCVCLLLIGLQSMRLVLGIGCLVNWLCYQ